MEYSFNKQVAMLYGVEEAIMVHNFVHWIEKNRANGKHFYKGTYWTYNSIKAFCEIFPFWTKRQIERILNSLLTQKAIQSDEFNEKGYDRTKWYSILDVMIFDHYGLNVSDYYNFEGISRNGEMDFTKSGTAFHQTGSPIPDSKTDSKHDIAKAISSAELVSPTTPVVPELSPAKKCQMFIDAFNKIRHSKFKSNNTLCGKLAARLRENYTTKDIFQALRNAMNDEYHKENNFKYLTPEFMLRPGKIDYFLNINEAVPAVSERKLVQ